MWLQEDMIAESKGNCVGIDAIVQGKKAGLRDLLTASRGSNLPKGITPVAILSAFAVVISALERLTGHTPHLDESAYAVFGIGFSLLLSFRNYSAYDRWWAQHSVRSKCF